MINEELKQTYRLNCDKCGDVFESSEAFANICDKCSKREEIREGIAKLMLWQHWADEYDDLEKCWQEAGEPTRDTYLRWADGVMQFEDKLGVVIKVQEVDNETPVKSFEVEPLIKELVND